MVRTRAEATVKVAAAKAPRKVFSSSSGGGSSSSSSTTPSKGSKYGGGNAYNPQPVPEWQKGIGSFFKPQEDTQRGSRAGDEGQDSTIEVGDGSGMSSRVCDIEQGEGSGVGGSLQGEGEGSELMDASPSSPSPSPSSPPKNGIISDDDD